ncbi:hypothetical protein [Rhodopirellula baltica]|uniref:Uncharacterized protein n=2 Tax=Rhodopirellula baltica TaxID=265606 RepID=F2AYG8_RHOBT|nr:hypothetical protein [Rhodopirellula baltica]EGF25301.1 conserved hypothetical protein, membrane [Rhodopirellula baltica WH47]ELP33114.1 hypothetical protein RBSWK_02960 [Rhodopirellula baltica SWK14]
MNFDEIQSIWNSQATTKETVERESILLAVVEKEQSLRRITTITDGIMIATLLFVAAMFFRDPVLQGHDLILILPGTVCLVAAGWLLKWRMDRQRRHLGFEQSLLGLIDKSIDGLDDRIAHMRNFVWWFAVPNALGLVIALFIIDPARRHLLYLVFGPAFAICMGLAIWQINREIRSRLLPEKQRFQELRTQFTKEQ